MGPILDRKSGGLFDIVAELYDSARPTYPDALFDDIMRLSGVPAGGRVLEIAPGTGKATLPIAERGFRITAIELGANLAAVARRNLASYPDVDVQVGAFEEWPLPEEPFDLVLCVSAFHWLDHEVALPKIAAALKPGGAFAHTTGGHVEGGTSQFFVDAQDCYMKHMPGTPPGIRLVPAENVPLECEDVDASGWFEPARHARHAWLRDFTTETYLAEISTYSSTLELGDDNRTALLECIRRLIDERYDGAITKAYLTDLHVSRRP